MLNACRMADARTPYFVYQAPFMTGTSIASFNRCGSGTGKGDRHRHKISSTSSPSSRLIRPWRIKK